MNTTTQTTIPREGRFDYDVVVIGGGIHGAGVARDAALRGLRVALFEKDDFASGTSSASSKLVHGGLRYLEQFQFGLVHESLREQQVLTRIAPHLVRPLPLLAPVYADSKRGRWLLEAGLSLYDLLAVGRGRQRHRWLGREKIQESEPNLRTTGLKGAHRFWDAQMDDARLVIENVLDAAHHGAHVRNGTMATGLVVEDGRVCGVHLRESASNREFTARTRFVVNAAGPWYADIAGHQGLTHETRPRLSRGTHIVLGPLTGGHAYLLSARQDGRVIFVLPFKGRTLVGTTDLDHDTGPNDVHPTENEIEYLLRELAHHLEGPPPRREDVLFTFAGVRALRPSEESDPGRVPRNAEIVEDAPGMLGILGGKYTTYRAAAERVVDGIERRLGRGVSGCLTARQPLPGGNAPNMNDYFRVAEDLLTEKYDGLEVAVLRYLVGTYGQRHTEVLRILDEDPSASERIEPGLPFIRAELIHARQQEWARDIDDVIRRRCYRAYLGHFTPEARRSWEEAWDATSPLVS